MWLPEVAAVEKLQMYMRLQTGRKGGASLLACHGLDLLVSHCGLGAVVSLESHRVICDRSGTSGLHFCDKCHHMHPTALPSAKEEGCFMFNMWI